MIWYFLSLKRIVDVNLVNVKKEDEIKYFNVYVFLNNNDF